MPPREGEAKVAHRAAEDLAASMETARECAVWLARQPAGMLSNV
jgi:hypothetical protein